MFFIIAVKSSIFVFKDLSVLILSAIAEQMERQLVGKKILIYVIKERLLPKLMPKNSLKIPLKYLANDQFILLDTLKAVI